MYDPLKEIVLMLDSFFKGLTDVGLILSYSVQVQVITLDITAAAKLKYLILRLIKKLKIIYSKLSSSVSDRGHGHSSTVPFQKDDRTIGGNSYEQNISSKSNINDQSKGQMEELVVPYAPLSLVALASKGFSPLSPLTDGKTEKSTVQKSCTETMSPVISEKLLDVQAVEKLGREKNETINALKLYNVNSILVSENALETWNHALNPGNVDEATDFSTCNSHSAANMLERFSSDENKEDGSIDNSAEVIPDQLSFKCDCDFQLVTSQDIATVLVVESLGNAVINQNSSLSSKNEPFKKISQETISNSKFSCSECGCDDLFDENDFEKHILEHNQCVCASCKKTFSSIEELQEHHRVLHGGYGTFECSTCDIRFLTNDELEKHARKHSNPFKCSFCDKSFAKKLGLTRHLDLHKKTKEATCDICGKAFSRADYLSIHKSIHAGKVLFSCRSCPKKFLYKRQLKLHEKIHTGVKDYICEICKKAFSRKDKLKEHIMRHYNIKRFQCNVCSKDYAEKRDLRLHMKTHESMKINK